MKVAESYSEWSSTYDSDRNLTRDLARFVTRQTLNDFPCRSILEIGCGTGNNTDLLAHLGDRVVALDFSEGMLSRARQKVSADNVRFANADLTQTWPVASQSFDLIVCALVLEHIEDISFIYSEAARALETGGTFFVSELHPYRQYRGKKAKFRRDQETIQIEAFVHHLSDFLEAAKQNDLALISLKEWWHGEDEGGPPRLVSFMFQKRG
jgi:ubiquinone/menaquinone biosynthesis C-methylase UbiE